MRQRVLVMSRRIHFSILVIIMFVLFIVVVGVAIMRQSHSSPWLAQCVPVEQRDRKSLSGGGTHNEGTAVQLSARDGGYARWLYRSATSSGHQYSVGLFSGVATINDQTIVNCSQNTEALVIVMTSTSNTLSFVRTITPVPLYSDGGLACTIGEQMSLICVFTRWGRSELCDESGVRSDTIYGEGVVGVQLTHEGKTAWKASFGKGWAIPEVVRELARNELYIDTYSLDGWNTGCNGGHPYAANRYDGRFIIEHNGGQTEVNRE